MEIKPSPKSSVPSANQSVEVKTEIKNEPEQDIGCDVQQSSERKYFDIFLPKNLKSPEPQIQENIDDLSDELIPVLIRQSEIKKHCLLDRFMKTDCGEAALITVNK